MGPERCEGGWTVFMFTSQVPVPVVVVPAPVSVAVGAGCTAASGEAGSVVLRVFP